MEKEDNVVVIKDEIKDEIKEYFLSLSEIEQQAYLIAEKQLKSSFIVEKTQGYLDYIRIIPVS